MKKRWSIRVKIFIIIIGILIPSNLVTVFICNNLLNNMKQSIINNQKNEMRMFTDQIQSRLDITVNYVNSILNDDRWLGMRYEKGSKQYELAKNNLWAEINDQSSMLSIYDGIYCYVSKTEESFSVRNNNSIMANANVMLLSWVKEGKLYRDWTLVKIGGQPYLTLCMSNSNFNLSIIVKKETILREWDNNSNRTIEIVKSGSRVEKKGYYTLETEFLNKELELVCYIYAESINKDIPFIYYLLFISVIVGVFVVPVVFFLIETLLQRPLKKIENTIVNIEKGNMACRIKNFDTSREFYTIENAFNEFMDKIYDLKIQTYEMELENHKAQLRNLQLQINPHFLLNALNTVYGLSEVENYETIQKFTLNLVKYLRYSLNNTNEFVTLKQEMDFIMSYIEIQKIRFPDQFYVVYDVEDELMHELIPPLIIENFVENCVKYAPKKRMTEILIIIKRKENYLNISICDDGNGIPAEVMKQLQTNEPLQDEDGEHIGIWNCKRRLSLFYGQEAKFTINSAEGEGTQIFMELPCKRRESV